VGFASLPAWCEPLVLNHVAPARRPSGTVSAAARREPRPAGRLLAKGGASAELGASAPSRLRGRPPRGGGELVFRRPPQRHPQLRGPACRGGARQAGPRLATRRGRRRDALLPGAPPADVPHGQRASGPRRPSRGQGVRVLAHGRAAGGGAPGLRPGGRRPPRRPGPHRARLAAPRAAGGAGESPRHRQRGRGRAGAHPPLGEDGRGAQRPRPGGGGARPLADGGTRPTGLCAGP